MKGYNYFQLTYREVQGILLYQGFLTPIFPTKHPERSQRCFFYTKLVEGTRGQVKFLISQKVVVHNLIVI